MMDVRWPLISCFCGEPKALAREPSRFLNDRSLGRFSKSCTASLIFLMETLISGTILIGSHARLQYLPWPRRYSGWGGELLL